MEAAYARSPGVVSCPHAARGVAEVVPLCGVLMLCILYTHSGDEGTKWAASPSPPCPEIETQGSRPSESPTRNQPAGTPSNFGMFDSIQGNPLYFHSMFRERSHPRSTAAFQNPAGHTWPLSAAFCSSQERAWPAWPCRPSRLSVGHVAPRRRPGRPIYVCAL